MRSVERLFGHLEMEIAEFKAQSSLHCIAGCGKCCTKPDIEATPLEFLPYAFHLFINGQAEDTLEKLQKESFSTCYIYSPLSITDQSSGNCSEYPFRGLICRLFGYGATRDKFGQLRLATCKLIKEGQSENYQKTSEAITRGVYVPIFSDYYKKLSQVDFRMGNSFMPVNKAIKTAIEEVLHHYAYRPFPKKFRKVA
ncbi:YkgJ family cysteine cluster protein [Marinoscillum sp. MHG1-6]|uniref:YkgJ family cysteine cluster protein n=1 Tax=Marinoscillum sp. MHG1-6 TaxID=2959627 RepID=UPI00215751A7|nr:YkgJ family cysteine cluster protein [Marinoscillum sp. MHG1-6]